MMTEPDTEFASILTDDKRTDGVSLVPAPDPEISRARADIEQTRANLSETLEAIKDKVDPQLLMDQAKGTIHEVTSDVLGQAKETVHTIVTDVRANARDAASDAVTEVKDAVGGAVGSAIDSTKKAGTTVMDTIKNNPLPALLLAGAGWYLLRGRSPQSRPTIAADGSRDNHDGLGGLLDAARRNPIPAAILVGSAYHLITQHDQQSMSTRAIGAQLESTGAVVSDSLHRVGDKAADAVGTAKDALGGAVDVVKEKLGSSASTVKETASQASDAAGALVHTVGDTVRQAPTSLVDAVRANPLMAGTWALGIGATIALLLPETEPENKLLGATRDKVLESAQQSAGSLLDRVHEISTQTVDSVTDLTKQNLLIANAAN
jgi:hypothetical protein